MQVPTHRNVVWLREILSNAEALNAPDVDVDILHPSAQPFVDVQALGGIAVADAYRSDALQAWAERFDSPSLDTCSAIADQAADADLVVGHELSPTIKRRLHARGCRYVSFHIHPLRMLRDLCLGATTNDPAIAAALALQAVPDAEISAQVHRFRALCRFHRQTAFAFPADLPVLVGQTERDSVLIENGRFVDWPDREDELAATLQGFDALVFIEHPFRADSRRIVEYLRCRHGKTVIATNANGYGVLLSAGNVPKVITLSSSLGVEAEAFGWPTEFLLNDPRQKLQVSGVDVPFDAPLGHGVFCDGFWRQVLGLATATPASAVGKSGDPFGLGEHYLRDSIESWSYHLFRSRMAGAQCRKTLMPHASLPPARRAELRRSMLTPWAAEVADPDPASAPDVTLEQLAAPIVFGHPRVVRGSDAEFGQLLGRGFHPVEAWGAAWSSGPTSELLLAVAPPTDSALLRVTLELGAYEGTVALSPVLTLSSDGRMLAVILLRSADSRTSRISVVMPVQPGLVRLVIEASRLTSAKQAGLSDDARLLGFGLTKVELDLRPHDDAELLNLLGAVQVWGVPQADGTGSDQQRSFPVLA